MVRIVTCSCCRRKVVANPRVKNQRYCGRAACQRERKRRWQQGKMATDPDYRANQREAQKSWRQRNPDYWRQRRAEQRTSPGPGDHPVSADVNMDALSRFFTEETREYMICPVQGKMDALRVKIIALSA